MESVVYTHNEYLYWTRYGYTVEMGIQGIQNNKGRGTMYLSGRSNGTGEYLSPFDRLWQKNSFEYPLIIEKLESKRSVKLPKQSWIKEILAVTGSKKIIGITAVFQQTNEMGWIDTRFARHCVILEDNWKRLHSWCIYLWEGKERLTVRAYNTASRYDPRYR